ncbi:MAG: hypothetical protein ACPGYV_12200, partial [Phycisphaeraceae bacterium]
LAMSEASVVQVRARMRSNDTLGPVIDGPYTYDDDGDQLPVAVMLRQDGSGGQQLVLYNDEKRDVEFAVISDLPDGWVDVELTLLLDDDVVSIAVNHEPVGSFVLQRVDAHGSTKACVCFASAGGIANFQAVSVRVGGEYRASSTTAPVDATFLLKLLNWLRG